MKLSSTDLANPRSQTSPRAEGRARLGRRPECEQCDPRWQSQVRAGALLGLELQRAPERRPSFTFAERGPRRQSASLRGLSRQVTQRQSATRSRAVAESGGFGTTPGPRKSLLVSPRVAFLFYVLRFCRGLPGEFRHRRLTSSYISRSTSHVCTLFFIFLSFASFRSSSRCGFCSSGGVSWRAAFGCVREGCDFLPAKRAWLVDTLIFTSLISWINET